MKPSYLKTDSFVLLAALLAGLGTILSGCTFSLPKDLASLAPLDQCPDWNLTQLEERESEFAHHTDTQTLQCALSLLRQARPSPIHGTAAGARICFLLAERSVDDTTRRERLAAEGVRWAEIALSEGAEEDALVHYFLAVNLGIAVKEHVTLAAKLLNKLIANLERAIQLVPGVDYAGPYRVLGMLYLLAPPWPQGVGDSDKALELLNKALSLHPDHPQNQIFYAQALWAVEEDEAKEKIQQHLEEGLRLLNQEPWLSSKDRWIKDLQQVAKEAGIKLDAETL